MFRSDSGLPASLRHEEIELPSPSSAYEVRRLANFLHADTALFVLADPTMRSLGNGLARFVSAHTSAPYEPRDIPPIMFPDAFPFARYVAQADLAGYAIGCDAWLGQIPGNDLVGLLAPIAQRVGVERIPFYQSVIRNSRPDRADLG